MARNIAARIPYPLLAATVGRWNAALIDAGASIVDARLVHPTAVRAFWAPDLQAIRVVHPDGTLMATIPIQAVIYRPTR